MDVQTPETRLKVLEQASESHERRITQHGREIDKLSSAVVEIRANDRHIGDKLSRIEGKVDTIAMRPADSWERYKWLVIGAVVSAVISLVLSRAGIG